MIDRQPADAGWYPDVSGAQLRWWDGTAWTEHVAPTPAITADAARSLTAERKRIFNNDMLYVTDLEGARVGSINLVSGEVTLDQPERRAEFDALVARWRASHVTALRPEPPPER